MGKSRTLNILIALLFFIGAGIFVISATGNPMQISTSSPAEPKKKYAPAKPSRGFKAPAPGGQLNENWPDNAFKNNQTSTPSTRALGPRGVVPTIREFANWKIGLRYISANVKDYLSLFFTMIGTFFTWRSYRIQKTVQRNHAPGSEG